MQPQVRAEVTSSNLSNSRVGRAASVVSPPARTMEFGWLTEATYDVDVIELVQHEFELTPTCALPGIPIRPPTAARCQVLAPQTS